MEKTDDICGLNGTGKKNIPEGEKGKKRVEVIVCTARSNSEI